MRALVVYESMFGSTRILAEEVARAVEGAGVTTTISVAHEPPRDTDGYGLVVIGAPTHAHGLPRASSRTEAVAWAADLRKELTLEPSARAGGVREWLAGLRISRPAPVFAAFSTRVDMAKILSGDAANGIVKRLRTLGVEHVEQECFLVSATSHLIDGERERAAAWSTQLLSQMDVSESSPGS